MGKDFVKFVKASISVCYSDFDGATLASNEDRKALRSHARHVRAARAAACAGGPSVSLGRSGQHGRARAHAAQPPHGGRTVPRELRRRDRPRRVEPSGRSRHRDRRHLRALHRSLRDMAEYVGAPSGCCSGAARGRRRRAPAAPPLESRDTHFRGDRVARSLERIAGAIRAGALGLHRRTSAEPARALPRRGLDHRDAAPESRQSPVAGSGSADGHTRVRLHDHSAEHGVHPRPDAARARGATFHPR